VDRCPHCGAGFEDVLQLVAHVEHAHGAAGAGGGSQPGAVVAGGGGGGSDCALQ
jgi:hypothetical protein